MSSRDQNPPDSARAGGPPAPSGAGGLVRRLFHSLPEPVKYHAYGRWQVPRRYEPFGGADFDRMVRDLRERTAADGAPVVWLLSFTTWFNNAFQRPQQLAAALAEAGCSVVYYEPWEPNTFVTEEGHRERAFTGVRDVRPRLHLYRCPEARIPDAISAVSPDVVLLMWPFQAWQIPAACTSRVVYDIMDDHSLEAGADASFHETHQRWLRDADVVTASADALVEQIRPVRPDVVLLPNGVRVEDWRREPSGVPQDMAAARKAEVVVGYHGALSEWFDWALWEDAMARRPEWSFVLVGPTFRMKRESLDARLARFPNAHYLGAKDIGSLPSYTRSFDVACIPFVLNAITHACSPLKLFEYMAAGRPVVATRMNEILKYESVLFAGDGAEFVSQVEAALALRKDASYASALRDEADANTWVARARRLRGVLESDLGAAGPRRLRERTASGR